MPKNPDPTYTDIKTVAISDNYLDRLVVSRVGTDIAVTATEGRAYTNLVLSPKKARRLAKALLQMSEDARVIKEAAR